MGLFKNRQSKGYVALSMPGWYQVRTINLSATKSDEILSRHMAMSVMDSVPHALQPALDESDAVVRELIYILANVSVQPLTPEEVAYSFGLGWLVGKVEISDGLARANQSSDAAIYALFFLLQTLPKDKSFTFGKALEAGYFACRTRVDGPSLVRLVTAGKPI